MAAPSLRRLPRLVGQHAAGVGEPAAGRQEGGTVQEPADPPIGVLSPLPEVPHPGDGVGAEEDGRARRGRGMHAPRPGRGVPPLAEQLVAREVRQGEQREHPPAERAMQLHPGGIAVAVLHRPPAGAWHGVLRRGAAGGRPSHGDRTRRQRQRGRIIPTDRVVGPRGGRRLRAHHGRLGVRDRDLGGGGRRGRRGPGQQPGKGDGSERGHAGTP
jgi:hypothetical protein